MAEAEVPSLTPYVVDVIPGRIYAWCSCGRSRRQPFCDGTHNPLQFMPLRYVSDQPGPVAFCGCKRTSTPPLCDGKQEGCRREVADLVGR